MCISIYISLYWFKLTFEHFCEGIKVCFLAFSINCYLELTVGFINELFNYLLGDDSWVFVDCWSELFQDWFHYLFHNILNYFFPERFVLFLLESLFGLKVEVDICHYSNLLRFLRRSVVRVKLEVWKTKHLLLLVQSKVISDIVSLTWIRRNYWWAYSETKSIRIWVSRAQFLDWLRQSVYWYDASPKHRGNHIPWIWDLLVLI